MIRIIYLIIFFVLGTLMGSFYTVVGSRLPKGESFITGRSHCEHCKNKLSLLDMIPIISYLFLRGRCRYCNSKIDSLSTWMELFTGLLFSLSYFTFGFSYELLFALGIVSLLTILSVSDISYYIIPDEVLIFFSGYFIVITALSKGLLATAYSIFSGAILFTFMYLVMLVGNYLFKKESLGGGDIKLMFVVGLVLSPFLGLLVIFIASVVALPISLIMLWKNKKNLVPFGPFLLTGFMFIYFTRLNMDIIIEFIKSI